jgi:hypothetical protein
MLCAARDCAWSSRGHFKLVLCLSRVSVSVLRLLRLAFPQLSNYFTSSNSSIGSSFPFKFCLWRLCTMTELSAGSGGLVYTPRMAALIAKAGSGVLSSVEGGQELRQLFREGQS